MIGSAARQRRIERALELELHFFFAVEVERLDPNRAADIVHQHVDPAAGFARVRHQ
jgi:hypothetical protein